MKDAAWICLAAFCAGILVLTHAIFGAWFMAVIMGTTLWSLVETYEIGRGFDQDDDEEDDDDGGSYLVPEPTEPWWPSGVLNPDRVGV